MNSSSNAGASAGLRPAASCYRFCTAADRTCSCRSVSADWSASRCTPCLLLPLSTVIQLSCVQPCTQTRLKYFHRALVSQRLSDTPQDIQFQHSLYAARLTLDAARLAQSPRRDAFISSAVLSKRNRFFPPNFPHLVFASSSPFSTWSLPGAPDTSTRCVGLAQSLPGSDCFGSVGVRPDSDLRSQP